MSEKDFSLPPGSLRSDALLIRHLAKPGAISIPGHRSFNIHTVYPKLAQTYRTLQIFILPDNIPWLFEHEDDLLPFQDLSTFQWVMLWSGPAERLV